MERAPPVSLSVLAVMILLAAAPPGFRPVEAGGDSGEARPLVGTNVLWMAFQGIYVDFEPALGIASDCARFNATLEDTRPSSLPILPGITPTLEMHQTFIPGMNLEVPQNDDVNITLRPFDVTLDLDCYGGAGNTTVTMGETWLRVRNGFALKVVYQNSWMAERDASEITACWIPDPARVGYDWGTGRWVAEGAAARCIDLKPYFDFENVEGWGGNGMLRSYVSGFPMSGFAGDYGLWKFCFDLRGHHEQWGDLASMDYAFKWIDGADANETFAYQDQWRDPFNWDLDTIGGQTCDPWPTQP